MSQPPEKNQHVVKGSEVFVGGLPQTITESKIREICSPCGEIVEIRLIKDHKGSVKGFCFVRFATKEAAEKAVKEKNGIVLDGKKIGVLPSTEQNTLYFGNLNKGWNAIEFEGMVRQVFPDVVSVELAMPLSTGEAQPGRKRNRGFAFVKFLSHADRSSVRAFESWLQHAAARAYRLGSKPDFVLGGNLHPTVQWAEEGAEIDPTVLAKIKIAFIRNLPTNADENYLKKLFEPFGMIERVVLGKKGSSPVGFVHFIERSDLENAIKEMNEKTVQGPNGGPTYKLSVEVARPMEKSKKRAREDSESKVPDKIPNHLSEKNSNVYSSVPLSLGLISHAQKEVEYDDPYEVAVLALPASVKQRLLRILRLGIATRFDIDIQSLQSLKELPESTAISVLDQFMLSGGDSKDKRIFLAGLISKYQVDKVGLSRFAGSLSRAADITRDSGLYSFSNRVHVDSSLSSFTTRVNLPPVDSVASTSGLPFARPDSYISRYSSLFSGSPVSTQESLGRMKEMKGRISSPLWATSTSSIPYDRLKPSPQKIEAAVEFRPSRPQVRSDMSPQIVASVEGRSTRPQVRFDPFTGEPYKFDPFTGERILPDDPPRGF